MTSEVARKLWEGRIPAAFELANHEVSSPQAPGTYYVMVQRSSYLTLYKESIWEFFAESTDKEKIDEMWFEFKGVPLRWQYPCGLLFDMLCDANVDLPWVITVHFQNFPDDVIMRCSSEDAIESHYMSMLKEADQLKHRGQVISGMSKNQHKQLWHGLKADNFNEFWAINSKFMEGYEGGIVFKNIPLRCYFDGKVVQKILSPAEENNLTMSDAIEIYFPNAEISNKSFVVTTQGIQPNLNTPVQWLSENLSYADNFLHICVHIK